MAPERLEYLGYEPPSLQKREDLDSISLATQILCFSLITPLVALRLFARLKFSHPFGVEDATCYMAWGLFMGHCICTLFFTYSGGTVSSHASGVWNHEIKYKTFYIASMFYVPMVLFVKTSLIYIMIRIWRPYRAKVISLYTFLIFIVCYYVVILFVKIFNCNPIRLYWEVNRHDGTCMNRSAVIIADSVISVITDLAILVFPIALTWSLNMPVSKKLHAIALLGAGSIAIAFSIYRLVLVTIGEGISHSVELFMKILLSDNAEGGLGLICTCIPAINKLVGEISRKRQEKSRERQSLNELHADPSRGRSRGGEDESVLLESLPSSTSGRES